MIKIYSDQLAKAKMLAEGLKKNEALLLQNGIRISTEKVEKTLLVVGPYTL